MHDFPIPIEHVAEMDQAYKEITGYILERAVEVRAELDSGAAVEHTAMRWSVQLIEQFGEEGVARIGGILLTMIAQSLPPGRYVHVRDEVA